MTVQKLTYKFLIALALFSLGLNAQQDAQYTQYMYNVSIYNPAYSGSNNMLRISALHRSQWVGIEGAPETQTFSIEGPLYKRLAGSLNVTNDKIGPVNEMFYDANLAYHLRLSSKTNLSVGLKGGLRTISTNLMMGNLSPNQSASTLNTLNDESFYTLGMGLYLYTDNFYFGLSTPNILQDRHFDSDTQRVISEMNHYYGLIGFVLDITSQTKFRPSLLVKAVDGAPLGIDISANFMFREKLILGAAYRVDAAVSGMLGFYLGPNLLLGYAYDYDTNNLNRFNNGSHEIFLGIEFGSKVKLKSPRFF